jgi:hypothetical protein
MAMLGRLVSRGALVATLVLAAGCATTEEWGNCCEGAAPRVRRDDLAHASVEGWWGRPITVPTDQILER